MIERFQSLVGLAAQTAATQLTVFSQSVDPFPEAGPRDAEAAAPSLLRTMGGLVLGSAESVVRREAAFGVVPDLARSLSILANATPVTTLSPEDAVARWNAISVAPADLWVDIGSGNGDTLGRLARRHQARFIGVDVENSAELEFELSRGSENIARLPENVRYLILSHNRPGMGIGASGQERLEQVSMVGRWYESASQADRLATATVDTIGAGTASVVSFVFPYLHYRRSSAVGRVLRGPVPRPMDYQMRTAVQLLKPGGQGVILLEAGRQADESPLVAELLTALRARPEIASIEMASEPVDVERFGVARYAPYDKEGRPAYIEAFPVARAFFFRRKG